MGLDAHVRCTCIKDGRANAHPFPDKFAIDETGEPILIGNPSTDEWITHDRWYAESCEHGGVLLSERLGNISAVAHLRGFLSGLEEASGRQFPILLTKVVHNGIHSGDWIPSSASVELSKELDTVIHSGRALDSCEKEFLQRMKRLCEASLATGNPIVF